MAVKKIKSLKGRIDCPNCFSLLQWDSIKDIKVSNGNEYVICPECGQALMLDKKTDYWVEEDGNAIIVDTLPETGAANYIYLVPDGDTYSAYKYEDGEWVSVSGGECIAKVVDLLPQVGEEGVIYYPKRMPAVFAHNLEDEQETGGVETIKGGIIDVSEIPENYVPPYYSGEVKEGIFVGEKLYVFNTENNEFEEMPSGTVITKVSEWPTYQEINDSMTAGSIRDAVYYKEDVFLGVTGNVYDDSRGDYVYAETYYDISKFPDYV